jgi:5'(3')-deoxyribonucleotidase
MKVFEHKIIKELIERSKIVNILVPDTSVAEVVEFSSAGYFIKIQNPNLPMTRVVLDKPCSGLIEPDTLIRDNCRQLLRCHYEYKANQQAIPC